MNWTLSFAPSLSLPIILVVAGIAAIFVGFGLYQGLRGAWLRAATFIALVAALFNPVVMVEERDPLKSVIVMVVDESDSQKLSNRAKQTDDAVKSLSSTLNKFDRFEIRKIIARSNASADEDATTALFAALKSALQDVPPEQVAGAVFITDGRVHDIPKSIKSLGFDAPVHALITGSKDDRDRRLVIEKAPRFGIVGEPQELVFQVEDHNLPESDLADVRVLIDGEFYSTERVRTGRSVSLIFDVPHGGKTIIELNVENAGNEITLVNNRAFAVLEGIRENLRVLLVSGEPHAGERTWRNLLKSDASVDLVHFTILRPPEKQDGTPINQLSLIAFPTRELFIEKIDEFDLIIFDRYRRRGVLPVLYFDNIARYVEDGGAILVASGPEYADNTSIYQTPLSPVLPAVPDGSVSETPFHATISDAGKKHPVTRNLPGNEVSPPQWSRWFRQINSAQTRGDVIMSGANGQPLLVLDRPGEGRIAMLLSDHVWLWARGFEGGGPHVQLLRRLSHWLMKEPELDEEALRATAKSNTLHITRQTMSDEAGTVTVITPTGAQMEVPLKSTGDGQWEAEVEFKELGLYQIANGELRALAHMGPTNPREYAKVTSTTNTLQPLVADAGGLVKRVDTSAIALPRIVPMRPGSRRSGRDWMGFHTTNASVLLGITQVPLFGGLLGLALLLGLLAAMWTREGR